MSVGVRDTLRLAIRYDSCVCVKTEKRQIVWFEQTRNAAFDYINKIKKHV